MGYKVAVVGATGNVGREMLDILAEPGRGKERNSQRARL
jgi:aspartate-semialdehyde dehydrogenase